MNTPLNVAPMDDAPKRMSRPRYLQLLAWAFTLFNTIRLAAYTPTLVAIIHNGDSSQHSLWTWCTWVGANATTAAWLFEHNGRRLDWTIGFSIGNGAMCLATGLVILWFRW